MGEMHDLYSGIGDGNYDDTNWTYSLADNDDVHTKRPPKRKLKQLWIPEDELQEKMCVFVYPQGTMNIKCYYWHTDDKVCYSNRSNQYVICTKLTDGTYKTCDNVSKFQLREHLT